MSLPAMAGNLFSGIFPTSYCHFNFLTSPFVSSGYTPSSALITVSLVVLEHPSIFLAHVTRAVSSCFTNFAFPSHTPPAYSSFGTVTVIEIHILIQVSRCESARIESILPTRFTLSYYFSLCVHPKSSPLRSLRQSTYTGLRSVGHLLPTSM